MYLQVVGRQVRNISCKLIYYTEMALDFEIYLDLGLYAPRIASVFQPPQKKRVTVLEILQHVQLPCTRKAKIHQKSRDCDTYCPQLSADDEECGHNLVMKCER